MSNRSAASHSTGDHYLNWGNDNTGQDSFRRARIAAELSSAELRDALHSAFARFADVNGVSENDARILLLNTGLRHQRILDRHRREELVLLTGCTPERLSSFTAAGLSASYNVPVATAEKMLARARQGRLI